MEGEVRPREEKGKKEGNPAKSETAAMCIRPCAHFFRPQWRVNYGRHEYPRLFEYLLTRLLFENISWYSAQERLRKTSTFGCASACDGLQNLAEVHDNLSTDPNMTHSVSSLDLPPFLMPLLAFSLLSLRSSL